MLIQSRSQKWIQDPGVADLIEHFDEARRKWERLPEKTRGYLTDHLSEREVETIRTEILRCKNDFPYCARNYFWIINRDTREDQLFRLWESQELILDYMNRMKEKGLSQRIVIIKARQLGCSSVAEGLMAHKVIFYKNTEGIIVSFKDDHAQYLHGIVQHIYDKLPWWMQPEKASLKVGSELYLDNPDATMRRDFPGMNSRVTAATAEGRLGVGQGRALVACHVSEFCDFVEHRARSIIEEDIENALAEHPNTFGILESTAKGAGTYSHDFWLRMEKMEDKARWQPVFLPWFFDRSRTIIDIPMAWEPKQPELDLRTRAHEDWVRCGNATCEMFHPRVRNGRTYHGKPCPFCKNGTLQEYTLTDGQLFWMERRRLNVQDDAEALDKLRQEMCTTAQEAFRLSGIQLFSERAVAFANSTVREPVAKGFIDKTLRFHGVNHDTGKCWCPGCDLDHSYDDSTLEIWEFPHPDAEYVVAGDTADGLGGKYDYLVGQVLRINKHGGPDAQVATWARNDVLPDHFADALNRIGRFYNNAVVAPETNAESGGTVLTILRSILNYPNLYRPLNPLNLTMETTQVGWKTTPGTKPNLYNAMRKALDSRLIEIRCKYTVQEIPNFRREDQSSRKMGAIAGHDDRIMALMIAYFVAHEKDWDPEGGTMRFRAPLTMDNAPVIYQCLGCGHQWPAKAIARQGQCPECRCLHVTAKTRIRAPEGAESGWTPTGAERAAEIFALANAEASTQMEMPDYDSL